MRDHYNGSIQNVALHRLEVMEPYLAPGEAVLCLPDAFGGSKILPKSVKAKTIERLPGGQHPRISLPGRTEFMCSRFYVHIVEHLRLEDLYAGEH